MEFNGVKKVPGGNNGILWGEKSPRGQQWGSGGVKKVTGCSNGVQWGDKSPGVTQWGSVG